MNGTLVSFDGLLLIAECQGYRRQFKVDPKCAFTLNGETAAGGDLRPGDAVEIDGQPATAVKATRVLTQVEKPKATTPTHAPEAEAPTPAPTTAHRAPHHPAKKH